jgi:hypothetical protein
MTVKSSIDGTSGSLGSTITSASRLGLRDIFGETVISGFIFNNLELASIAVRFVGLGA